MATEKPLADLIRDLHALRVKKTALDAQLAEARAQFELDHAMLFAQQATTKHELDETEALVRTMAVTAMVCGDPLPAGVTAKRAKVFTIDPEKALAWCKAKNLFLVESYDEKALCKMAEATPDELPFVTIDLIPKPSIATDLSKHFTQETQV